jgi:NAD(P)-dependent dehydrogenase (short-subunit alcohol dehydrogenase family)
MTDADLSGRVALVTGGSRGIGAATALRLAEAGADVAVGCGQHREAAEEIAGKITGLGRRAVVVSGDMADPDVPRRIVTETAERLAPVDILVANAGTGVRADLDDVDAAAWDHVMAVNLRAPFLLAQAVVPHMRERLSRRDPLAAVHGVQGRPDRAGSFTGRHAGPGGDHRQRDRARPDHDRHAGRRPEAGNARAQRPGRPSGAAGRGCGRHRGRGPECVHDRADRLR